MFKLFISIFLANLLFYQAAFAVAEKKYWPASNLNVVNYARNLTTSIVDTNFRGTWVVDTENTENKNLKIPRLVNTLLQVKIGSSTSDVKKLLGNPIETKNNGKTWLYGQQNSDKSYKNLTQVFFDEKHEKVISIISFNPKATPDNIGISIGDTIDKMITVYGEPIDEKDFIEDPDNKEHLGMYYLYPRSGVGFFIGQDKNSKNPTVQGIIVFGFIK